MASRRLRPCWDWLELSTPCPLNSTSPGYRMTPPNAGHQHYRVHELSRDAQACTLRSFRSRMSDLRKKLKPLGVTIKSVRKTGWHRCTYLHQQDDARTTSRFAVKCSQQ